MQIPLIRSCTSSLAFIAPHYYNRRSSPLRLLTVRQPPSTVALNPYIPGRTADYLDTLCVTDTDTTNNNDDDNDDDDDNRNNNRVGINSSHWNRGRDHSPERNWNTNKYTSCNFDSNVHSNLGKNVNSNINIDHNQYHNTDNSSSNSSSRSGNKRTISTTTSSSAATTTTTTTATAPRRMSEQNILQRLSPEDVSLEIKDPVNPKALEQAKAILAELSEGQQPGTINPYQLLKVAKRLGDVTIDCTVPADLIVTPQQCAEAYHSLTTEERTTLQNMYTRIKSFAELQRSSVQDTEMSIPGGKAGHTVSPCQAAGCYAPGGRYPLPSSVLMTAVTARAAGCPTVVLASPKPAPITLAAAHVAGADIFLRCGGAQAIATMAYGVTIEGETDTTIIPPCDVICGPGNQWVTAAKSIVQGKCGIDMLAGPSEVLVICDDSANAAVVASDLIAQAEHDVIARAILLSTSSQLIEDVDIEVSKQVQALPEPNRSTALAALQQSFAVQCRDLDECIRLSDDIAPEHLEIQTTNSQEIGMCCKNYGGLFIGVGAAEVLGDYGAGPNHTLPTGGTGRYTGGLSVFNFLRIRTWMRIDNPVESQGMVHDAIVMARLEGLEGHARAAEQRKL